MPIYTRFCLLFATCLLFAACYPPKWHARVSEQISLEDQQRIKAMIAADTTALSRCLTESLTWIHTNGHRETKQEFIAAIASGKYKFSQYNLDSVQYRVLTKSMIVTQGSAHIKVFAYQKNLNFRTRYTAIYNYNGHYGWRLASWQNTKVADVVE